MAQGSQNKQQQGQKQQKQSRDDHLPDVDLRAANDMNARFSAFYAIAEKHPEYDFIIVNNARQSVERHWRIGWRPWSQESLEEIEEPGAPANVSRKGEGRLPAGRCGDGEMADAILMYQRKGFYDKIVQARHEENQRRKSGYGQAASANAQASVGGDVDTYTPEGFGDGMKVEPDSIMPPSQ